MGANDTIADWIKVKEETPLEEFLRRHHNAFLLQTPLQDAEGDYGDAKEFCTSVVDLDELMRQTSDGISVGASVYPVIKAPGNPYPDRVSVGRAQNCDIVIADASVSKLHAHFAMLTANGARLRDANSSNGTRANGRVLEAGKLEIVASGDTITFGAVSVQFFGPRSFYSMLVGSSS